MPVDQNDLPPFIPGLELSERFYHQAVGPLLAEHFPALAHAAGRLDAGSDVLGFDTAQSRDHHWGARLTLFVNEDDFQAHREAILRLMGERLPFEVDGYPTHFTTPEVSGGTLGYTDRRPISHGVTVTTAARFTTEYLGVDATREVGETAWLSLPSQKLATVRAGRVFHDGVGVEAVRERLSWYPRDVWLYRMANQWVRLAQEEAFVGRCGDVGDELGSRLVAARQILELMRLCFLMERTYAPYSKWFGSAFARLECGPRLAPLFHETLSATEWRVREHALGRAYLLVCEMHNALGVTEPLEVRLASFHERPYLVPHAERYVEPLLAEIRSPAIRALPPHVGAVDQFADSTDVLCWPGRMQALAAIYRA